MAAGRPRPVTLLEFLAAAAAQRDDARLQTFLAGWATRLRAHEGAIRSAVVALADDPDVAVQATSSGITGKIGHGAASVLGTFGEWFDRRAAR